MAIIKPFKAIRPRKELAAKVAALPYDVVSRAEAKEIIKQNPKSFLSIDRPDAMLDDSVDTHDKQVYEKAYEIYQKFLNEKILVQENQENYYLYALTMNGRTQTGLVCCASVDDYLNEIVKKHENTRKDKEEDRIRHVDNLDANTGPIFLANKSKPEITQLIAKIKQEKPENDFLSDDGIKHQVWTISDPGTMQTITTLYEEIPALYIADGHHRCASAVAVAEMRRKANPKLDKAAEANYFLAVIFDQNELVIMDYNRVVKDLNQHSKTEFLELIKENFTVKLVGEEFVKPEGKANFSMYLDSEWYTLTAKTSIINSENVIASLDVSILQDYVLQPILQIEDPRTDARIDFVGGIRGYKELEKRVDSGEMAVAFALYPTSMDELFAVADKNLLMPPKSTWFEPKLRSGLFIHDLESE